jgi:uncharacterized protein YkwD
LLINHSDSGYARAVHAGGRRTARSFVTRSRSAVIGVLVAILVASAIWMVSPLGAGAQSISPVVGIAATPSGQGAWVIDAGGRVVPMGDAVNLGSASGVPAVALAPTPSGAGYWIADANGGVGAFGDAANFGSAAGMGLRAPIIGMAASPTGGGYWLLAADGGIFSYGDSVFHGSTGAMTLAAPIVAMASTASGRGYWLVASDGGIFSFGDAGFFGSTGGLALAAPIVGMAATPTGAGYWLVAGDGGVFAFGDASFAGSAAQSGAGPIVALTRTPNVNGYEVATADGRVLAFSTTPTACPSWVFACASAAGGIAVRGESPIASDLLSRANAERAARGLAPLAYDPVLTNLGNDWARAMASSAGFNHRNLQPVLDSPYFVGYVSLGENIYWGSGAKAASGAAHQAWMQADGHRRNMLNPGFDTVGIGVYCAGDGKLWLSVNFGRVRGSAAPALSNATPPAAPLTQTGAGVTC